ncbi:leukocyte elastase inhibitor-like [Bombus pyrosoma]|uniref:leukocyte elastase inhibitor-like n=1 Tax=Bombus pyrosoma TaxID=396416 RepID=UPI001CB95649|nr:leukocyte elastase inhibitor-like [Bombus pyrosoma]XP_043587485.1 leukocyte elastase inhibitor-like [Bombus pyrosoma]
MKTTLIFLCLTATCFGQLIYPDDKLLASTTVPSSIFPNIPQNVQSQDSVKSKINSYQVNSQLPRTSPPTLGLGAPQRTKASYPTTDYAAVAENTLQGWNDHVNNIIANGVLKFGLDVEREIHRTRGVSLIEQRDNIVFSPTSLAAILAIVLAGSAGRTFDEASKVLGLEAGIDISQNSEIVHQMFGVLLSQLQSKESAGILLPQLNFATAAYVQNGFPILPQFKLLSKEIYQTDIFSVDFARNGKGAEEMINMWVQQKTKGKITSILNHAPGPGTAMILLSALYFNGEWDQYFLDGATKRKPFFIEPDETVNVNMMYNGGTFPFYLDKKLGAKIIGFPYKGRELSMYVLLPTAPGAKALREFKNKLTVDIIENLIKNAKNETCIIGFPRMKLSTSLSLRPTLAALGLESLFDPATADLSLISQSNVVTNMDNRNQTNVRLSESRPKSYPTITTSQNSNEKKPQNELYNDMIYFPSRFYPSSGSRNQDQTGRVVKRNYFTYEDKIRGYNVEQWANGFFLRKTRDIRDVKGKKDRSSYTVEGRSKEYQDNAKIVNLEENKYRFEEQTGRNRRQTRPIDQNFLDFVRHQNLPSYGLDRLRNNANLVNPHLFATDVLQKVEMDITEKGTEAAAVTSVVLERDGSQKRFIANRPFIFFIRHDPSKLVLFWGTINVPTPNYPTT